MSDNEIDGSSRSEQITGEELQKIAEVCIQTIFHRPSVVSASPVVECPSGQSLWSKPLVKPVVKASGQRLDHWSTLPLDLHQLQKLQKACAIFSSNPIKISMDDMNAML